MWTLLALAACTRCPEGYAAKGGVCEATTTAVLATPRLPTEASFPADYEDELCDQLEDCWCDAFDLETCEPELDCPDVDAPIGCAFDPVAADECLHGRYDCDTLGGEVRVIAPDACSRVYDCAADETADTGPG